VQFSEVFNIIGRELLCEAVHRERYFPELEIRRVDVDKVMSLFLLDQVFEDADIFGFQNLDSEHLISSATKNKAVERTELVGNHEVENVTSVYKNISMRCDKVT
jgi:hypothetical protein